MLKFYVSLRPIKIGTSFLTGHEHLQHSFKGLDVSGEVVASDFNKDGRILYQIKIGENSNYTPEQEQEYKAALLEGLQLFGCHEKSLESAKALAESITDLVWSINGDSISPPPRNE